MTAYTVSTGSGGELKTTGVICPNVHIFRQRREALAQHQLSLGLHSRAAG
jgi:hypothetical protein